MTKYYSRSKKEFIEIANMTDQHVRNAFVQMCKDEPAEDVVFAQQQSERADKLQDRIVSLEKTIRKLNNQPTVTADAYDVAWKKIETLEKENKKLKNEFSSQFDYSKNIVKGLRQSLDDALYDNNVCIEEINSLKSEVRQARNRMMLYAQMINDKCPNGHAYVFSEIPNDDEGREFVQKLKDYLNKESYKMRVRGQYLDDETKQTEGWRKYERGQPIEKSKCLRVYVDVKKD
jgi:chromosome segregation ATPase